MVKEKRNRTGIWIFLSVLVLAMTLFVIADNAQKARKEEVRQSNIRIETEQKIKDASNKINAEYYDQCLDDAYKDYKDQWADAANAQGSVDGRISQDSAELLDDRYSDRKKECLDLYPTNN